MRITRDGPTAVIEYADPTYGGVNLTIGDRLAEMSDQQVVDVLNDVLAAQAQSLREWDNTVTEIPLGKPQIKFNHDTGQWLPQGEVLRCIIVTPKQGALIAIEWEADILGAVCGRRVLRRS